MTKKVTTEEAIRGFRAKHGDTYVYGLVDYVHSRQKVIVVCRVHGDFPITPNKHLSGGGCPQCHDANRGKAQKQNAGATFVPRAIGVHGDGAYLYDRAIYRGALADIEIGCRIHGYFWQAASNHLQGKGCQKCGIERAKPLMRSNTPDFIEKAIVLPNAEGVDFSEVEYVLSVEPVTLICEEHGPFEKTPQTFLAGQGCQKCGRESNGKAKKQNAGAAFVPRAIGVHGDGTYLYDRAIYRGAHEDIEIGCRIHGYFWQAPNNHLQGKGCQKCSNCGPSKAEDQVAEFVESLGLEVERSRRTLLGDSRKEIDIYIPSLKIGIEFNGVYWHSNSQVDVDDRAAVSRQKRHIPLKTQLAEKEGIRLVHIFEDDWANRRPQWEGKLRSILGKDNRPTLRAGKCEVREIQRGDGLRAMLQGHHIQGGNGRGTVKLGLYFENALVAAMTFVLVEGEHHVDRFVTGEYRVHGAMSKLMKHFKSRYAWETLATFAALDYSVGQAYQSTGWTETNRTTQTLWYVEGRARQNRQKYMKKKLVSLFGAENVDTSRKEHQICHDNGVYALYSCGVIRYEMKNEQK